MCIAVSVMAVDQRCDDVTLPQHSMLTGCSTCTARFQDAVEGPDRQVRACLPSAS